MFVDGKLEWITSTPGTFDSFDEKVLANLWSSLSREKLFTNASNPAAAKTPA